MKKKKNFKIDKKVAVLGVLAIILLSSLGVYFTRDDVNEIVLKTKTVDESLFSGPNLELSELELVVYPELLCTCCDKPLADCECGLAKDMRDWLDDQVIDGVTKEELLVRASKEFGMKTIESEESKEIIKNILIANAGDNPPAIEMENTYYDFGEIKQSPDKISTSFEIKNSGKSDLVIDSMDTSCMCTSATITYKGIEGPVFGMSMHGKNPTDWNVTIPPGETATLNVYYDPMAHGVQKKDRLQITRTVTLSSNDPVNFQKEVRIELVQVK